MMTPTESGWRGFWRRFPRRRSLSLLLGFSLLLLALDVSGIGFFQRGKFAVTGAAAPLIETLAYGRHFSDGARRIVADHLLQADANERLRAENARLREWRAHALNLRRRLSRYEELLQVAPPPDAARTARVLGEIGGPFERAVILQAGRAHGILYGHGVVDAHGLVGRIVGVGETTSRALLLTDFNSRVPVFVEPSGARGIAGGDGGDALRLEFLPEGAAVSLGDRVVTSGAGGLLPAGLLVGVVVSVEAGAPVVAPFMDAARLEWARVLLQSSRHDIPETPREDPLAAGAHIAAWGESWGGDAR